MSTSQCHGSWAAACYVNHGIAESDMRDVRAALCAGTGQGTEDWTPLPKAGRQGLVSGDRVTAVCGESG